MKLSTIYLIYLGRKFVYNSCKFPIFLCLHIIDVPINWETANSTCVSENGKLSDKPVIGIPGVPTGLLYWSGLHRIPNSDLFQTEIGPQFANSSYFYYYKWKTGHPKADIDCVAYDEENKEFLSSECSISLTALCQIGKYIYIYNFLLNAKSMFNESHFYEK